jgi:nucleotide-binding universal stress UspA family protein
MKPIVVGVDGSQHSLDALRWAVAEAELRDAKVVAVHAFAAPQSATAYGGLYMTELDFEALREAARRLLVKTVEETVPDAPVEILQIVAEGPPAGVLVAAAKDASLLVVGSRGRGGFKGLLLGSVSQQVAQHAPCPVVVVRPVVPATGDEAEQLVATANGQT